jgi:hypothetical protein
VTKGEVLSVKWKWNQKAMERELGRLVRRNLGPEIDRLVAEVRCPDHPEHRFVTDGEGDELHLSICCQKGAQLAAKAAGLDIEWSLP